MRITFKSPKPPYLKSYYLDKNDEVEILGIVKDKAVVDAILRYLHESNEEIFIDECYDGQSGWHGFHFILDNIDFSGNGYCFDSEKVKNHIENKQNNNHTGAELIAIERREQIEKHGYTLEHDLEYDTGQLLAFAIAIITENPLQLS